MTCEWVNSDVRILVVDDERLMRDLMALSLRRLGYLSRGGRRRAYGPGPAGN